MQSKIKSMNNCDNNRNVDSKNAAFREIDQAISLRPHHLLWDHQIILGFIQKQLGLNPGGSKDNSK